MLTPDQARIGALAAGTRVLCREVRKMFPAVSATDPKHLSPLGILLDDLERNLDRLTTLLEDA